MHGAQVIMVRGNFDDCLRPGQGPVLGLPGRAGQLGQPGPPRGAEDRGVRDRRLPRRRPRLPPAAGRQRRQHLGLLAGLHAVRRPRPGHPHPGDARLPGRGRRAAGDRASRSPTPRPRPPRSGSATPPPGSSPRRPATSRAAGSPRSATTRSWPRSASWPPATASSSSRPRPPASPGLLQELGGGGVLRAARRWSITVTGHGLKDTATALEGFAERRASSTRWSTPTSRAAAAPPGSPEPMVTFVDGPVRVTVPATSANLGPGFDSLGLALDAARRARGRGHRLRAAGRGRGCRRGRRTARRDAPRRPLDAGGLRRCWGPQPPGLRLACRNVIPHARGLGSSSAAIVGGRRRWPAAWWPGARRCSTTTRCSSSRRGSRATPTTSRPPSTAASPSPATRTTFYAVALAGRPAGRGGRASCRPTPVSTEVARGLLPDVVPHAGRGGRRRSYGAAGRCPRRSARAAVAGDPRLPAPGLPRPAMPESLALVDALRADGVPAIVSGAGPTVLAFTDACRGPMPCWVAARRVGGPPPASRPDGVRSPDDRVVDRGGIFEIAPDLRRGTG